MTGSVQCEIIQIQTGHDVNRGSGKTFVSVPDRTAATLTAVICGWIEAGNSYQSLLDGVPGPLHGRVHIPHRVSLDRLRRWAYSCSHEHDRTSMPSCQGLPRPLQPAGGLNLSPRPVHVRSALQVRKYEPVHEINRPRADYGP
jgi:hypothetical protein